MNQKMDAASTFSPLPAERYSKTALAVIFMYHSLTSLKLKKKKKKKKNKGGVLSKYSPRHVQKHENKST